MQPSFQYVGQRFGGSRADRAKDDASDHGFGLMKMRAIAKKYGSVLDISYDENRFTVMTALKLLPEKKNQ